MQDFSKSRGRPIPFVPNSPSAMNYSHVPVDRSDPRFQEPLVELSQYGIAGDNFYARTDGLNPPYKRSFSSADSSVRVRLSLAKRLSDVNEELGNLGLEIFALNGYRPIPVQQELWDFFISQARKTLNDPTEDEFIDFAGRYCSDPRRFDPNNSETWPTHITGGAIDLTLRNRATKEHLFFGSTFDDPAEVTHTAYFEQLLATHHGDLDRLSLSDQEALQNRRLLYWAMGSAGFTNYAFEWWHFDLGTQLWAANRTAADSGNPQSAWYGPATP